MKNLFVLALVVGLGILAALPFRRDPSAPNPVTKPAQATGPTESVLFDRRLELAIDAHNTPEFRSLALPQPKRRPDIADKQLQVPDSYEDLAVKIGPQLDARNPKFTATVKSAEKKRLDESKVVPPRMKPFAATAESERNKAQAAPSIGPKVDPTIDEVSKFFAKQSAKRRPSSLKPNRQVPSDLAAKPKRAKTPSNGTVKTAAKNSRSRNAKKKRGAAVAGNAEPKAAQKAAEDTVSFGSSFARLEGKQNAKPQRMAPNDESKKVTFASSNRAGAPGNPRRLLGTSEQQLPKPSSDRQRHWIKQP